MIMECELIEMIIELELNYDRMWIENFIYNVYILYIYYIYIYIYEYRNIE